MITIHALRDEETVSLPELGLLRPIPDMPAAGKARLQKKIEDGRFGPFLKQVVTQLYSRQALLHLDSTQQGFSFQSQDCLGLLLPGRKGMPMGYVVRPCGIYRLALPVYDVSLFSPAFYRVAGYMVTGDRYVAVVRRRVLFWVVLAFAAGAVFSLSYLTFAYGFHGALQQLSAFFQGLLP